jgi:hypothetical protein
VPPVSDTVRLESAPGPQARRSGSTLEWLSNRPAFGFLAVAAATSGAILLVFGSHLTFWLDEWDLILYRRGLSPGIFLDPHNEHITIAPVAIYKALLAVFGMTSSLPFAVTSTAAFLLSGVLLFALVRRRIGDWPAVLGTVAILFLGAAWSDLLSPFQVGYFGSMAAGLGALLALDRDHRLGDRLACVLIVISTTFSELGIPFAIAAMVQIALGPRPRLGRVYVALVPVVLYGVWWLGWGHTAVSSLSLHNAATTPEYVLDEVSAAVSALLGLAGPGLGSMNPLDSGRALLLAGVGLAALRLHRLGAVPRGVWVTLALGVSFWVLSGLNENLYRLPENGRYIYPSAVFIVLIAAELLSGLRIPPVALIVAAVVATAALASNLSSLHEGYRFLLAASDERRADLAALEISRPAADPGFELELGLIRARPYFSAVDAFGSPAYTQAELAAAPESLRAGADTVLANALRLRLATTTVAGSGVAAGGGACRLVRASSSETALLHLGPGEVIVRDDGATPAEVLLGRFSDGLPVDLGSVGPARAASLTIPPDRSTRPWRLGLGGKGAVTVCAKRGSSA